MSVLSKFSSYMERESDNNLPMLVDPPKAISSSLHTSFTSTTVSSACDLIPQLDGAFASLTYFECENCRKSFPSKDDLDLHNELNQYGCDEDECGMCFTSKYLADLHELEMHPETSYARIHIPDTTKVDYINGKRCTSLSTIG